MEKFLILGAGIYQVPLIKKCKEMGYYTIVSSIAGNYPGFAWADKVYYENTTDEEAILRIAKIESISAILTTGTDVAVKTIGYVCDKLHLHGVSYQSAQWVTNKALMKEHMLNAGVSTPKYKKVFSSEEAMVVCQQFKMPVVFKCVDKSGSRGITKISSLADVEAAYQFSSSYTDLPYIIIEEFVDGYEIGVDGYIGDDIFISLHDKIVYNNGSTDVPLGHIFPCSCSAQVQSDVKFEILNAVRALGLKNTFFNADVIISADKSYIIEIGARCGATCIPELISIHYGIDYYECMIKNALGQKVNFPDSYVTSSMGELLVSFNTGMVKKMEINLENCPGVEQVAFDYQPGEMVREFKVGPDRIGHIIVSGNTTEEARRRMQLAKSQMKIIVEE